MSSGSTEPSGDAARDGGEVNSDAASFMGCGMGLPSNTGVAATAEDRRQWPWAKMQNAFANFAKAGSEAAPAKGFAVLVTTGAMNPIHLGHVQLLHQAKIRLEQEGYGVAG